MVRGVAVKRLEAGAGMLRTVAGGAGEKELRDGVTDGCFYGCFLVIEAHGGRQTGKTVYGEQFNVVHVTLPSHYTRGSEIGRQI